MSFATGQSREQFYNSGPLINISLNVSRGPGKRGHIVAHDVSWAAQTGKHLLRTQINVSEQNQKHLLCPQQMLRVRANEETFVSATICPQQCVLVCQGLKNEAIRNK